MPFSKSDLNQDFSNTDFLAGALIAVDKPKGWTSFDVVNKIRGLLRKKYKVKNIKVGHAGTLDPMATGLLLIATGKWTKRLDQLIGLDKKYKATIRLGIETDTYDAEGRVISEKSLPVITEESLHSILNIFTGTFEQYPPAFSAIKQDGKKMYELARAGKEVQLKPRSVQVYSLQLLNLHLPDLDIMLHCASGFYVRSLAHDLGARLGSGAHLTALERTAIGEYELKDAIKLENLLFTLRDWD